MISNYSIKISILILVGYVFLLPLSTSSVYSQTKNAVQMQEIKSESTEETETADESALDEAETAQTSVTDDMPSVTEGESLFSTVKQGGPLMVFLVILGLISITLIIERVIYFYRNKLWNNKQLDAYLKEIADKSNAEYHEDIEDELRGAFQLYANGMEKGMSLLSGIGNLSPIVGFLGTVIGMISAFAAIAAATTVNAKVVAVGIQIALVTTAGGLMVAAPALTFYYLFAHIIQNRYTYSEEAISKLCGDLPRLSGKINKEEVTNG